MIKIQWLYVILVTLHISTQHTCCKALSANNECDKTGNSYCFKSRDFSNSHIIKKTLCELCFLTLPIARSLVESNRTKYFHGIATHLCEDLKIADNTVCDMAVSAYEVMVFI